MHDPAYKQFFTRPRMVRDLLDGFAARGWSDTLDFETLTPMPASYVGRDLRQRHGDLVWRIRFRDEGWLYVLLLLEFQATVDAAMSVRMLSYTALLYERLVADGVLRAHKSLPPVLPVVIYNGRAAWTAAVEMSDLVVSGGEALSRYQPSQRYYLLDETRLSDAELPSGNLVSSLIGLEKTRGRSAFGERLQGLIELLRGQDDEELREVFATWVTTVLRMPSRLRSVAQDPLARLEEAQTMLEETVQEWTREWVEQGRAEGVEQGRAEGVEQGRAEGVEQGRAEGVEQGRAEGVEQERMLLCRLAMRKFDAASGEGLSAALAGVTDPDRLAQVGDWIIECETAADLLARVRGDSRSDG